MYRVGQQFEHLATDGGIEVGDQDGGDLRMLLLDHRRNLARVEPVEQFDLACGLWRSDPREHAFGFFATERAVHHRLDLGPRVEADRGAFAGMADEIVEHVLDFLFADIGHREHRLAQLADFLGIQLLQNRGGFLLVDQHHQHGGALDTGIGARRDERAHDLIISRTASAARVGLSRVKPRTAPIRSS